MTDDKLQKLQASCDILQGLAVNYWDKTICKYGTPVANMLEEQPVVANAIVDVVRMLPELCEIAKQTSKTCPKSTS